MKKVGLAVMRIQPLHRGHTFILSKMAEECETAILGIGSVQAECDFHNPWSFEQRKQMVQNVFGDRIKILPLTDLGTTSSTTAWVDYVLSKISKVGLPEPTDYYTGSVADGKWYTSKFHDVSEDTLVFQNGEPCKPSKILHNVHREGNIFPPATDLRTFISMGVDDWKQWVPRVNHELVEYSFPNMLRIAVGN